MGRTGRAWATIRTLARDANGFYITTNEFSLAGPGFFGSQIYAFSKRQLAAGAPFVNVVQFDTSDPSLGVQLDGTPVSLCGRRPLAGTLLKAAMGARNIS